MRKTALTVELPQINKGLRSKDNELVRGLELCARKGLSEWKSTNVRTEVFQRTLLLCVDSDLL